MKRAGCEMANAYACRIRPASGLALPASSVAAWRRNATASRTAAIPSPATIGSVAG